MSELTKLRERWVRLENQIAKLDAESAIAMDDEIPALTEKMLAVRERLNLTIAACHAEELRLIQPGAKLIFRLKPREKKPKKKARNVA